MTARTETTANFDLATVQLPELKPLQNSFAVDNSEEELRNLFISLFREYLAGAVYDANVSGAMHLGSYDLVRRAVNADGLVLLQGDRTEPAVRYLYRAWRARNRNGRGMFFLRTYLQLLFPNLCQVAQLWQAIDETYPYGLWSELDDNEDGTQWQPDPTKFWLTSRVEIALDLSLTTRSITTLTDIFRSILPARLVPQFRFWLRFDSVLNMKAEKYLFTEKNSTAQYPWAGYRVMHSDDAGVWNLGSDAEPSYYIRLGGTPVEYECETGKEIAIGFPWADLVIARADDPDVWNLGVDGETGYKYRISPHKIDWNIVITKV